MGDFNLNHQSHASTGEFLDTLYSYMFYSLITRPSRVTSSIATLIDNIFTNNFDHVIKADLFFNDISDNFPVFTILGEVYQESASPKFFMVRDDSVSNQLKFRKKIQM